MTAKKIVLVTGVNGYIAARTVESLLDAGYAVRGTVRSASTAGKLLDAFSSHTKAGDLEVVEVKDITVDGAFDDAVKGVHSIAHLAAPVSFSFTDPEPVMRGAVHGAKSIMESAVKYGGSELKSVVMMSSIAAVYTGAQGPHTLTEKDWNNWAEAELERLGKAAPGRIIYVASKAAAEKAFWEFKTKNPSFAMVAINPGFVMGPALIPAETPDKINETSANIYTILSGGDIPTTFSGTGVDVRDVARLVTWAIDNAAKANGERYLAIGGAQVPQAIADILNKAYPERNLKKGTPGEGYLPGYGWPEEGARVDNTKAVKATGQDWIPLEKTVLDAAKQYERYL